MKEAEASASTCAFIRGEELPLTPAAWHKGPRARRGARPLHRPPSLSSSLPQLRQTSEQKQGLSLPSASIPTSGPRRRQRALLFHLFPVPLGAVLRGHSSLPSDKKDLCWDFSSDRSQPQSMAFSFFWLLSSTLLRPLTLKIPKYL